ncbi:MAG: alpha-amylase, partial [Chloroflexota bacterium]|nr:alpha-amylase [Chloroflexota bacterium]
TVLGALEYRRPKRPPMTLAVIQVFVPNDGNAWDFTLERLRQYLTEALAQGVTVPNAPEPAARDLLDAAGETPPQPLAGLIGDALAFARLLGSRTAGLHQALANADALPHFAPEPFSSFTQRSLYQSMRGLNTRVLRRLRQALPEVDGDERRLAGMVVEQEARVERRFARILDQSLSGSRIRGHGDYHLRQVLRTGDDVVIVDFEGEPDRYLEERRLRISPLRDVGCMLHSLRAATRTALLHIRENGIPPEDDATLDALVLAWYRWVGVAFLDAYQRRAGMNAILPVSAEERALLIDALVLEKAIYELGYTLDHVPDQLARALQCVIDLLGDPE